MLAALVALDGPRVSVEQAADGSLVWSGERRAGERGFLEDCEALVDARLAIWPKGPA